MNIEYLVVVNILLLVRLVQLYPFKTPFPARPVAQATLLCLGYLMLFQLDTGVLVLLLSLVTLMFVGEVLNERSAHDEAMSLIVLAISLVLAGLFTSLGDGLAFRPAAVSLFASVDRHLPLMDLSLSMTDADGWMILCGVLLLANEGNLLVRAVFRYCGLTPERQAALREEMLKQDALREKSLDRQTGEGTSPSNSTPINAGAFRAGRVIGFLERWLMLLVIIGGDDLSALGFIIAAKGLARMKQLEDRAFAEYMLIGTLMSALLSLIVGLWLKRYL